MSAVECPSNGFSGRHVPRGKDSAICAKCGAVIASLLEKFRGMASARDGAYRNDREWTEAFNAQLAVLAASGQAFTSEDVTEVVGFYREPGTNQNNAVGALMSAAAHSGLTRRVGERPSRLTRQHGALIAVWRGVKP